ncbi:hypothetical protein [Phenylobacterium sp.]|uniref:hypothetical protein n=1 Tax=Phenylobacterium sp. TaxID=1871053 RepID=UPI0012202FD0|nr:hypothetical protein [Phenylobacterium sp.]THD57599.1 MAG: hypothetical protein E8A49_22440 [Phenylobacterium sp.]
MFENRSFAYSLSQVEEGWRWSVYDEDGVTVADGSNINRDDAQAAVDSTLRSPLASSRRPAQPKVKLAVNHLGLGPAA